MHEHGRESGAEATQAAQAAAALDRQRRLERVVAEYITTPPDALYDLGVGPKTEWQTLGEIFPAMQLHGCEPDPVRFAKLVGKFPGKLHPVAIGNGDGTVRLHVDSDGKRPASVFTPGLSRVVTVPLWSLDQFDAVSGRPSRVLLWMDIEGAELDAIRGGAKLLRSGRVKWINLEEARGVSGGWRPDPRAIRAELAVYGFRAVRVYNKHRSHQDVIFVHRSAD